MRFQEPYDLHGWKIEKVDPLARVPLCVVGPGGIYDAHWPGFGSDDVARNASNPTETGLMGTIRSWVRGWWGQWVDRCPSIRVAAGEWKTWSQRRKMVSDDGAVGCVGKVLPLIVTGPEGLEKVKEGRHAQTSFATGASAVDPEAAGYSHVDSRRSAQSRIFTDDAGNRRPARRQQGHRIRAHRNARAKRFAEAIEAQGTLFGIDLAC